MKKVTIYMRSHCTLCAKALATIEAVRAEHPFELTAIDVDRDMDGKDPRRSRFSIDVPVIEVDGVITFKHLVEASAFRSVITGQD